MKLKFKQTCKDKYNGATYSEGETYEFEDERALEILKTGLAEKVEEEQEQPMPKTDPKEDLDKALNEGQLVNLHDLTIKQLKELAKEKGVSTSGKKDDIIERLLEDAEND